jgi:hypothetical protein
MATDVWERIAKLREEAFSVTPSDRSSPQPMASPSSAERQEYRMWVAIAKCEEALEHLVTELEKLVSIRKSR